MNITKDYPLDNGQALTLIEILSSDKTIDIDGNIEQIILDVLYEEK